MPIFELHDAYYNVATYNYIDVYMHVHVALHTHVCTHICVCALGGRAYISGNALLPVL